MEHLSDEALATVLQYVDNEDLLRCRVVCRRWRELVGHPEVWRYRSVRGGFLHLTPLPPRCYELELDHDNLARCAILAATTKTAATSLAFDLTDYCETAKQTILSALVIRHHGSLGYLKNIRVSIRLDKYGGILDLLGSVLSLEGLQDLDLYVMKNEFEIPLKLTGLLDWNVAPASLRKLSYQGRETGSILELLLRTYATSLREICLSGMDFCDKVVKLLPNITLLDTLTCPLLRRFEDLPHSIKDITIDVQVEEESSVAQHALRSTVSFFQSATHLTRVILEARYQTDFTRVMELAKALGHSGHSAVTYLRIEIDIYDRRMCEELWNSVSRLPQLEKLKIKSISLDLLCGLQPAIAPNLIKLSARNLEGCICCRWRIIRDMLLRNPALTSFSIKYGHYGGKRCDECKERCKDLCPWSFSLAYGPGRDLKNLIKDCQNSRMCTLTEVE